MKAYTDLEQSKVIAQILPLKSADMEYMFLKRDGSKVSNVPFVKDEFEWPEAHNLGPSSSRGFFPLVGLSRAFMERARIFWVRWFLRAPER